MNRVGGSAENRRGRWWALGALALACVTALGLIRVEGPRSEWTRKQSISSSCSRRLLEAMVSAPGYTVEVSFKDRGKGGDTW